MFLFQTQNVSLQQTAVQQQWLPSLQCSTETSRRMSEPCHTDIIECKSPPPRPSSVQLSPLKPGEHHPNQEVVLDEVEEGEMVENKLVIPDEMVHYLNQVADTQNVEGRQLNNWQNPNTINNMNSIPSPAANYNQVKPPTEEIMQPASNKPNNCVPSPMNSHNINQVPTSSCSFNRFISSPPSAQMNHPSPSSINHVVNSPGTPNINQILPSPSNNMNHMMPSPTMNMNQMLPSPASNYNGQNMNPNQMISSSHVMMSPRSHSQIMSPAQQGMPSPGSQTTCPLTRSPAAQMPSQPNVMGNCNSRQGHVSCYGNWNNTRCVKTENMCSPRQTHKHEYNQHCQTQAPHNPNGYCNTNGDNMNYQMCPQYGLQNKAFCHRDHRNYPPMHSPGVVCNQQISEPLSSPAVAKTAPVEQMGPPQTAQMSRPCVHNYEHPQQQSFQAYNAANNPAVSKVGCYPNHPNKMCYHQPEGMGMEIQCKDISQSQISPGVPQTNTTNMRHDTYQRTLEYVQSCQSWVGHSDMVSSSTHPLARCGQDTSNMIINDMSSSLTSLLEENRYLQMIQ